MVSATLGEHELEMVYCKTLDDGSVAPPERRVVQPRCLVCVDHAWYVVANDPMRGMKARRFALFRMQSAKDTDREFVPNGPFDLEAVLGDTLAIYGGGPVETVEVLFQPSVARYAREQFWHKSEKFSTAEDGRLRLTMQVAVNPEVEMRILRSGADAEVMGPVELRESFARKMSWTPPSRVLGASWTTSMRCFLGHVSTSSLTSCPRAAVAWCRHQSRQAAWWPGLLAAKARRRCAARLSIRQASPGCPGSA